MAPAQVRPHVCALRVVGRRVSDAAVFAALSEMTALKHLQLSMFNNGDQQVRAEAGEGRAARRAAGAVL